MADFDIGDDAPAVANDAPTVVLGGANIIGLPSLAARDKLRPNGLMNILAQYAKRAGADDDALGKQFPAMSLKSFLSFCATAVSVGTSNLAPGELGNLDWNVVDSMDHVATEDLVAALTVHKTEVTSSLTDKTVVSLAASIKGARAKVVDTETAHLIVPGHEGPLVVSIAGPTIGRCVGGGKEFVDRINTMYGTKSTYTEISARARMLAFFICTRRMVSMDTGKGVIKLTTIASHEKTGLKTFFTVKGEAASFEITLARIVKESFLEPANRPVMGSKKLKLSYVEYCVHKSLARNPQDSDVRPGIEAILRNYKENEGKLANALRPLLEDGAITIKTIGANLKEPIALYGTKFVTAGTISSFVEESRDHIRDQFDVVRKSDAPFCGKISGSSTSVAQTISNAVWALKAMSDKDLLSKAQIDAFGVGDKNHWEVQLKESFPGQSIQFYDKVPEFQPKNGGSSIGRNINDLIKGSGRGRVLFDDVHDAEDNARMDKISYDRKLRAILEADYDAVSIKMMYGVGSMAADNLNKVPDIIMDFVRTYGRVTLSQGSAMHSLEYRMTASRLWTKGQWVPPPMDPVAENFYGTINKDGDQSDTSKLVPYIRRWLGHKAIEVIVANSYLNLQISSGYASGIQLLRPLSAAPLPLFLNGQTSLDKTPTEASIALAAMPESEFQIE